MVGGCVEAFDSYCNMKLEGLDSDAIDDGFVDLNRGKIRV